MNEGAWLDRVRREQLTLALDLDGTLIPFASRVEEALLDRAAANLLSAMTYAGIRVVIVSGRKVDHVEAVRIGGDIWWVAEHGAWRRGDGEWEGPSHGRDLESLVRALSPVAAVDGALIERKSQALCVHWRCVAATHRDQMIETVQRTFQAWLKEHPEFDRLEGVESLEVRHRSKTKADAVAWIRERIANAHVLAIGDGDTDEDMFAALRPDEVGVVVGADRVRRSRARVALSNPSAVRDFLWWMVEARTGRATRPPPIDPAVWLGGD
jgi:trehalose 6-phosphate synthase/phosphatase